MASPTENARDGNQAKAISMNDFADMEDPSVPPCTLSRRVLTQPLEDDSLSEEPLTLNPGLYVSPELARLIKEGASNRTTPKILVSSLRKARNSTTQSKRRVHWRDPVVLSVQLPFESRSRDPSPAPWCGGGSDQAAPSNQRSTHDGSDARWWASRAHGSTAEWEGWSNSWTGGVETWRLSSVQGEGAWPGAISAAPKVHAWEAAPVDDGQTWNWKSPAWWWQSWDWERSSCEEWCPPASAHVGAARQQCNQERIGAETTLGSRPVWGACEERPRTNARLSTPPPRSRMQRQLLSGKPGAQTSNWYVEATPPPWAFSTPRAIDDSHTPPGREPTEPEHLQFGGASHRSNLSELDGLAPERGSGMETTVRLDRIRRGKDRWRHPGGEHILHLNVGAEVEGRVTNVTKHGTFLDIGAQKDGLLPRGEMVAHGLADPARGSRIIGLAIASLDVQKNHITLRMSKSMQVGLGTSNTTRHTRCQSWQASEAPSEEKLSGAGGEVWARCPAGSSSQEQWRARHGRDPGAPGPRVGARVAGTVTRVDATGVSIDLGVSEDGWLPAGTSLYGSLNVGDLLSDLVVQAVSGENGSRRIDLNISRDRCADDGSRGWDREAAGSKDPRQHMRWSPCPGWVEGSTGGTRGCKE